MHKQNSHDDHENSDIRVEQMPENGTQSFTLCTELNEGQSSSCAVSGLRTFETNNGAVSSQNPHCLNDSLVLPKVDTTDKSVDNIPTLRQGVRNANTQTSEGPPPPSYSDCVFQQRMNPCASIQFVAPIPPPSYDGMDTPLRYLGQPGLTLGMGSMC